MTLLSPPFSSPVVFIILINTIHELSGSVPQLCIGIDKHALLASVWLSCSELPALCLFFCLSTVILLLSSHSVINSYYTLDPSHPQAKTHGDTAIMLEGNASWCSNFCQGSKSSHVRDNKGNIRFIMTEPWKSSLTGLVEWKQVIAFAIRTLSV